MALLRNLWDVPFSINGFFVKILAPRPPTPGPALLTLELDVETGEVFDSSVAVGFREISGFLTLPNANAKAAGHSLSDSSWKAY